MVEVAVRKSTVVEQLKRKLHSMNVIADQMAYELDSFREEYAPIAKYGTQIRTKVLKQEKLDSEIDRLRLSSNKLCAGSLIDDSSSDEDD